MNLTAKGIRKCILVAAIITIFWMCCAVVAHGAVSAPYAMGYITDPEGVNIRSSASPSSSIVNAMPEGTTFTVVREKFTSRTSSALDTRWFYISSKTYGKGYIRGDLFEIEYSPTKHVATSEVNIRTGAGDDFDVVDTFEKGSSVYVRLSVLSSKNEEWSKVSYDGGSYYVWSEYLTLPSSAVNTDFENELSRFPSSYRPYLRELHKEYPAWHFEAKKLNFSWNDALKKQISNPGTNTVGSNYMPAYAYKAVNEDTYNFDKKTYITYDSGGYVSASKSAVAYFMDPRNWLDEYSIFMFEKLKFDPNTQLKRTVENILENTAIPTKRASSYMQAAKDYDISPVYLAAKSKVELGGYDDMVSGDAFSYNGKTYRGYYNAYNIGAYRTDNASAIQNGLNFARTVDDYYLGPWNTLDKAIRGGAKFIAEDFIGNNQHTIYYQHFNVANGLDEVGTHPYMTAIYGPYNEAWMQGTDYNDSGLIKSAFTFEIPVYEDMPSKAVSEPPKGNNNNYLDSIKVYEGDIKKTFDKSFSRFANTYELKYKVKTSEVTVKAVPNDEDASVTVSGHKALTNGENKITIKVKSSSGLTRYYYVYLMKRESVEAPNVTASNNPTTGKPLLTWKKADNADVYKVYRSTSKDGKYTLLNTVTGCKFTNTSAATGKKYYYKVKAVGTSGVVGNATSQVVSRVCDLPRPVVTASNDAETGKVKLTWKAVAGASKYEVYRATSKNGTYVKKNTQVGTTYVNTATAEAGQRYYYKVKAIHDSNTYANSAYSKIVNRICDLPRPVVTASNDAETGKVKLTWETVEGASKYEIYRSTSENGTYVKKNTQTGTTYVNTVAVEAGKLYYYKVRALHENCYASSADSIIVNGKAIR